MVPIMGVTNRIFLSNTNTSDHPLEKIMDKYKNPSVTCINKHMTNSELSFTFQICRKKSD